MAHDPALRLVGGCPPDFAGGPVTLRDAESIHIITSAQQEALVATFAAPLRLDNFALQLKPRVWVGWGNLHQFP